MILLVFLFPVAVYLLVLAFVNRAPHPIVVGGIWDFIGLLFATSGFLLFGGPAIINGLYEQRRFAWALGHQQFVLGIGEDTWYFWAVLWVLYFGAIVGFAVAALLRRRRFTSIYNVDADVLDATLAEVLDGLRLRWTRTDNHISITLSGNGEVGVVLIEVDAFEVLRHVSLRWASPQVPFRREIEAELRKSLAAIHSSYNPAGTWLLAIAAAMFSATFFGMILFFVGLIVRLLDR